jgi:hypothetical protein
MAVYIDIPFAFQDTVLLFAGNQALLSPKGKVRQPLELQRVETCFYSLDAAALLPLLTYLKYA